MEEQNLENLSRRERRKLYKEEQKVDREKGDKARKLRNWGIGLVVIAGLFAVGYWLYKEASKPLPGEVVTDLGAEHKSDISGISYNSNPPTSGTHFPIWAKRGVYDRVISDGHLVHSLEHGYVVISYNCDKKFSIFNFQFSNVYAQESTPSGQPLTKMNIKLSGTMSFFTPDNPPDVEVELSDSFKSDDCKGLVEELVKLLKDYQRLIIVPRPNLDSLIAVTSWGRIDKMEKLDIERIKAFASAFHNRGPEKTIE